ncbi:MAG: SAM-dependent methyltransferase [Syntrophales bacterium]|jgi:hypothetical protein
MKCGLYRTLVDADLLVPHSETGLTDRSSDPEYKVILPEVIPFISYPYEWCFSQLKDAALATLKIQQIAQDFGMCLKDSSAYNIQFRNGKPILIDTLSFEIYREGEPWVAYRQFCQHFLAPLSLMSYKDIRLSQLLRLYIDGIPIDLASSLLPLRTRFKLSTLLHIHLHARSQRHFADKRIDTKRYRLGHQSLKALVDNLESAVKRIKWHSPDTEWGNYYEDNNYSSEALTHKKQIVREFLDKTNPRSVWDLGANNGLFSRIASDAAIPTLSFDIDPLAVEQNYLYSKQHREGYLLPLWLDLTNPSPGIGWENKERMTLFERGPADTVLALALIHHLAIANNLPLSKLAQFFKNICHTLVIEYVPKEDSQVQRMLASRADIFPDYSQEVFEREFRKQFSIEGIEAIKNSKRCLYVMAAY